MSYRAPVGEMRFLLDQVLGAGRLAETGALRRGDAGDGRGGARRGGAARRGRAGAAAAGRRPRAGAAGERRGADDAGVRRGLPAGRGRAAGSGSPPSPAHGGMGLPVTLATCVGEMFAGANLALSLAPLLTPGADRGAGGARRRGAEGGLPAAARRRRLDRDDEPDRAAGGLGRRRGADAGRAARRRQLRGHRAEDLHLLGRPRHGGERLPSGAGAAAGGAGRGPGASRSSWCRSWCRTRDGRPGVANAVRAVSLEHKMGLHGSPTCVMEFDGAPRLAGRRAAPGAWRRCSR